MQEYRDKFIKYVIAHQDEIRYCGERYVDFGFEYVFKMPSPKKFLGIFKLNYRFTIYDNLEFPIEIIKIIDVDTIVHAGVRFELGKDTEEFMRLLTTIFKRAFVKWHKEYAEQCLKDMVE